MSPQREPNNRVTLAVLGTKLDLLTEAFKEFRDEFVAHLNEDRVARIDIDRLTQVEKSRVWHLRTIWATIAASVVGWAWTKLGG